MKWLVALALTVAAAAALAARTRTAGQGTPSSSGDFWSVPDVLPEFFGGPPAEPEQSADLFDQLAVAFDPSTYMPANVDTDTAARNVRAFLDAIAWAEGTAGRGDNGYNILFGGGTFASYADHPRQSFAFTDKAGRQLRTTAAGRYQFLARTWDGLRAKLGLADFGPASQDAGAIELVRERGALRDVQAGRFTTAITKVRPVWASLPGAGYAQPERSFSTLLAAYQRAGGFTVET